jgi:hypothetical protein
LGGINEQHVEWAVVSRLAMMLDEPQHRLFDVTHTYALFVPILCWTMQRMRQNDPKGRVLQDRLRRGKVTEEPWHLPLKKVHRSVHGVGPEGVATTQTPKDWPIEPFLIALRNSVAHGDSRNVFPFHRQAADRHELVGFKFKCKVVFSAAEEKSIYGTGEKSATWQGEITLLSEDMRRIGCALAREFCSTVSGDKDYFEREAEAVTEPLRAA